MYHKITFTIHFNLNSGDNAYMYTTKLQILQTHYHKVKRGIYSCMLTSTLL